jgi:hypothetical protein
MKLKRKGWVGHVPCMKEMETIAAFSSEELRRAEKLIVLGPHWRMILI